MANLTSRAQMTTTPFDDTKRQWDLAGSLAVTYYPGCMMGLNASGYAQKLDDTERLRFLGINAESQRIESESGDSNGDKRMNIDRPFLFQMTIASAAITDVGKKVFSAFDGTVQYSDGTYGNYVGKVYAYIDSTTVLIAPPWSPLHDLADGFKSVYSAAAAATTTLTREDVGKLILVPNTAAVTINLPAVATCSPGDTLTFFKTTSDAYAFTLDGNSAETINGAATLASSTTQYDSIRLVTDGAAWYALERAGTFGATTLTGDLTMGSGTDIIFSGTTGQSEIHLTDNLADALSLKIAGGADLLIATTTNSSEGLQILSGATQKLGFFGATNVVQAATTGTTTGFTAGSGTAAKDDSTFTGDTGTAAYTVGDIVKALKDYGLMAAS